MVEKQHNGAEKGGPLGFANIVTFGFLAVGVALVFFPTSVPALVVSVVLSCSVASLLYGILGGVSEASFDLGRFRVSGSAAVLLGGVWMFNSPLERQLAQIRDENRIEQFSFDFDEHAAPSDDWFAINESTGIPVEVAFTDPVTNKVVKTVSRPSGSSLPFKLLAPANDRYLILGATAKTGQEIGYVSVRDLTSATDSIGWHPKTVYGGASQKTEKIVRQATGSGP